MPVARHQSGGMAVSLQVSKPVLLGVYSCERSDFSHCSADLCCYPSAAGVGRVADDPTGGAGYRQSVRDPQVCPETAQSLNTTHRCAEYYFAGTKS